MYYDVKIMYDNTPIFLSFFSIKLTITTLYGHEGTIYVFSFLLGSEHYGNEYEFLIFKCPIINI